MGGCICSVGWIVYTRAFDTRVVNVFAYSTYLNVLLVCSYMSGTTPFSPTHIPSNLNGK